MNAATVHQVSRLRMIERREVLIVTVAEGMGIEGDAVYEGRYIYDVETGALIGSSVPDYEHCRPVPPPPNIRVGARHG